MLTVDPITQEDLDQLLDARHPASVTIYLESSPIPADHEAIRIALRNAAGQAERELESGGASAREAREAVAPIRELVDDHGFWEHQANSLAIFASDGRARTFRLANRLTPHVSVGDRFDVGALLRANAFRHGAYVLALATHDVTLYGLGADHRARQIPLELDQDELSAALAVTDNDGRADQRATPSDRHQREGFARIVQRAVLPRLRASGGLPLILAATPELDAAYRAVNEYEHLLPARIDVHPSSLDPDSVDARAREILHEQHRAEVEAWRELFGTRRSAGRATSSLADVARATVAAAVEELWFDMDAVQEGEVGDDGEIRPAPEPGPATHNLVDDIVVRVLRSGGRVRAVRQKDLVDGSPVAAVLRFPREAAGI
ncbi:hypothetical protein GC722_01830 [Auraticoccus sp. F435]|uniref:Uncharacterized protein n=1 Tax=Auraticoccus cholistanensis TaxID=2656650 RepID=A0A6A9V010_9ACTN|nr:hypothetical protein [Auraticoccus cholistanensis]MVA74779.1 hypothetical protein [Auraticoccus cholistanensis]